MDVSYILDDLNDAQRQAVTSESKKLLVLAGAGSGKTKVLVHRIAWLIKALSNSTHSILSVTFTNKAANEMTGRIEQILDQPIPEMWCGTFHSISNRLLRRHYKEAGLEKDFSILDSDDQLRVIKRNLKELDIDAPFIPDPEILRLIHHSKNSRNGLPIYAIEPNSDDILWSKWLTGSADEYVKIKNLISSIWRSRRWKKNKSF